MINAIGQSTSGNAYLLAPRAAKGNTDGLSTTTLGFGSTGSSGSGLLKSVQEETLKVGFGQGTVSVPGAIVNAIDKNMQNVKQLNDYTAAKQREQAAEQKQQAAELQAQTSSRLQATFDVAATMSRSVSDVQARLAGDEPASGGTSPTITVNGQSVPYLSNGRQLSDTTASTPRFNILA